MAAWSVGGERSIRIISYQTHYDFARKDTTETKEPVPALTRRTRVLHPGGEGRQPGIGFPRSLSVILSEPAWNEPERCNLSISTPHSLP